MVAMQYETDSSQPLKARTVLGIGAHPDDLDFMASGTMAKLAEAGAEVHYLILTDGGKGSDDAGMTPEKLMKIRMREQRDAATAIGAKDVSFLDYEDGRLEVTMELKRDIVRAIRKVRPDVVFAMDPSMLYAPHRNFVNHPDHRAGGQAVLDAVFPLARDHLSFPELYAEGYEPHKVRTVLLTNFNTPNFFVDITDMMDKKLAALAAHPSQVPDMDSTAERVRGNAAAEGRRAGLQYAEGFVRIDIEK
jgi:LmbE family N-acetylglucosaminyl deacetylase